MYNEVKHHKNRRFHTIVIAARANIKAKDDKPPNN